MDTTGLSLIKLLWDEHGILSLGWIVAILLAGYVVFLHARMMAQAKGYYVFAAQQAEKLVPVLEKTATALSQVVTSTDDMADCVHIMNGKLDTTCGKVDAVVMGMIRPANSSIDQPVKT